VQALIGTIGGLSAVVMIVNAAVKTWEAMTKIVTAAQWLWNAAMSANPLMLIVLAIAAVVAIVVVMYNKFSWFRDFVGAIAGWFVDQWHLIVNVIGWVADKVRPLGDIFGAVFALDRESHVPGGGRHQMDRRQDPVGDQQGEGGR
jgi:hypothetical protein